MYAGTLLGISLLVNIAVQPRHLEPDALEFPARLTDQQKEAVMVPLIKSATDCVSQAVASDPRLGKIDLGDLIADSFSSCITPVRTLIDTHDRIFGGGTGERYFMGPYLDDLPSAVSLYVSRQKN